MATAIDVSDLPSEKRESLFGVTIDALRMEEAVDRLLDWLDEDSHACRYVVTPNVDHAVMLQTHTGLRQAYADAGLVLADGHPVVLASKLLGKPLPERVAGSDLVPALFDRSGSRRLRVYLLGAGPGVAERAAENIVRRWPNVEIVGTFSPPIGFDRDEAQNAAIVERVNATRPDVLVVGLGAPKQELWVHKHHGRLDAKLALCVGATIDFLAGERRRAPRWMQRCGLEWFHRLMTEPRRLAKRYAHDAWIFPRLVWREWRTPSACPR